MKGDSYEGHRPPKPFLERPLKPVDSFVTLSGNTRVHQPIKNSFFPHQNEKSAVRRSSWIL